MVQYYVQDVCWIKKNVTLDLIVALFREVFHSRDQNHVTAKGESILGVKFCNSCSGSGRHVIEISC